MKAKKVAQENEPPASSQHLKPTTSSKSSKQYNLELAAVNSRSSRLLWHHTQGQDYDSFTDVEDQEKLDDPLVNESSDESEEDKGM